MSSILVVGYVFYLHNPFLAPQLRVQLYQSYFMFRFEGIVLIDIGLHFIELLFLASP